MALPKGFHLDDLELWHVKDNGIATRLETVTVVTEHGVAYGIFQTDSLSHFVFFGEKIQTGGGSTYQSVVAPTEHGSVTLSGTKNKLHDTVTITATAQDGYQVGKVTVQYASGREVAVTRQADGTYTYKQPGATVTVTVTFVAQGQWPFVDVAQTHWFYGAVAYVYEAAMMQGVDATHFAPNGATTRAMIATVLHRLEGTPEAGAMTFTDVDPQMYYYDAIAWAQEKGIVTGYSDQEFGPNDNITREQLAAILYRYSTYLGRDVSEVSDLGTYGDVGSISNYAIPAVRWMCGAGLMEGKGQGHLDPRGPATRAQVAMVLMRFLT